MIRILLAEDDDVMREYLARALTSAGYHVTAVDRGTEAVPYIDSGTFDLLLSDIVMPEMDGIELAQHTAKAAPQTQVMFITGFAAVSLRAEENVPQAKLLSKLFHLKDLVREVDMLFGRADRSNQQYFQLCARRACQPAPRPLRGASPQNVWACSSVVEHCVDIAGVASSILATPTIHGRTG